MLKTDAQILRKEHRENVFAGILISPIVTYAILDVLFIDYLPMWLSIAWIVLGSFALMLNVYGEHISDRWNVCHDYGKVHLHYTDRSRNRCLKKVEAKNV